jgi:mannose-6-phosphate isomerase
MQPITFIPIYQERVWGGRRLETELRRPLPANAVIGESWEMVDRQEAQSVVSGGPYAGKSLHDLWNHHRLEIFGEGAPDTPRYPVLAKILDCRETLSVQVHPPASVAARLGGEPKTEMWYLLDADADASLYAGFQDGVTQEAFQAALEAGHVEPLLHHLPVGRGDAMFIPSGRCHAIGAGCLIIEIQQNSDTTYRVFDWNRVGLDGKPRALHIEESLASMDFSDVRPSLAAVEGETVVGCEHFTVDVWRLGAARRDSEPVGSFMAVIEGCVSCAGCEFRRGDCFLLPASSAERELIPVNGPASVLRAVAR